jgi:hypothetical protein
MPKPRWWITLIVALMQVGVIGVVATMATQVTGVLQVLGFAVTASMIIMLIARLSFAKIV